MPNSRYRILDRIDVGGMAEVFRGISTIEGFERTVAIKRVLPNLTHKRKFIRMFMDEAKLALQLVHANIVPVFDIGVADDTSFIVMEYVEGVNLNDVLDQTFLLRAPVPLPVAVFIAAEVCKGLAYAHERKDAAGDLLGIVHRDVSPPNILLSVQGEVKIADFGLAKARSQLEHTDPGLVKGKFGYLSPEAAYGESIDHRTDLFAVGILLWEMLAADRLFVAETEPQTLELVRKAIVPPIRKRNADVPEQLEAIIQRALSRDKTRRYQRAADLGHDLTSVLFDYNLRVASSDVAALVEAVREARGGLDHAPPAGQDHFIEDLIQDEIDRFIPVDDIPFDDGTWADPYSSDKPLEDPNKWFDVAQDTQQNEPVRAVEVAETRVGPTVSPESLLIPIHVVQEAVEEAQRSGALPVVEAEAEPDASGWVESRPGAGVFANAVEHKATKAASASPAELAAAMLAAERDAAANPPPTQAPAVDWAATTHDDEPTVVAPPNLLAAGMLPVETPAAAQSKSEPQKGRPVTTTVLLIILLLTLGALALSFVI